jgi:hypothetical protein
LNFQNSIKVELEKKIVFIEGGIINETVGKEK